MSTELHKVFSEVSAMPHSMPCPPWPWVEEGMLIATDGDLILWCHTGDAPSSIKQPAIVGAIRRMSAKEFEDTPTPLDANATELRPGYALTARCVAFLVDHDARLFMPPAGQDHPAKFSFVVEGVTVSGLVRPR